mmetsp:Transcript_10463/g.22155  ORF Transcript_10463/g.22155 Transcript_10463/m.22155 type:complete len:211 (+) Transcript_10463:200-832(+)
MIIGCVFSTSSTHLTLQKRLLPERLSIFINRWNRAVFTLFHTRFILEVTFNQRFRRTTRCLQPTPAGQTVRHSHASSSFAFRLGIPQAHLLQEQKLILLIRRPAHVHQIRHVLPLRYILQETNLLLPVIMVSPRKVHAAQRFHSQSRQRAVFVQQCPQCLLVARHGEDHVSQEEERSEEEFRFVVVAYVVESGVGAVGRVPQGAGAVVLE